LADTLASSPRNDCKRRDSKVGFVRNKFAMLNRFAFALPYVAAIVAAMATGLQLSQWPDMPAQRPNAMPQQQIDAGSRTPLGMVVNWARTVQASRARPESLTWDRLMASRDGSVVCIAFTDRHAGEAPVTQRIAFLTETTGVRTGDWDTHCSVGVVAVADAAKWISAQ
jgi:hypothetical protein